MRKRSGIVAGFALGLLVSLLLASVPAQQDTTDWKGWDTDFFKPLGFAARQVQVRYVDDVDPVKLRVGAYYGMLSQLDHSSYLPPGRTEEFEEDTTGGSGGLGVTISFNPARQLLKVERPIPGSPAFKAGVLPGDVILNLREEATGKEQKPSAFADVRDALLALRGEPGSKVTLTVYHDRGRTSTMPSIEEIVVTRALVTAPGVHGVRILDQDWKIGYAYVPGLGDGTAGELQKAVKELAAQGLKALIVDLRFNEGGSLANAVSVADLFLPECTVVTTKGRASPEQTFKSGPEDTLNGAPLVVLVNRYTAGGAEIVAGALKDNRRAIVIGETTSGQGSTEQSVKVSDALGSLMLATARCYTPAGGEAACIEKNGVKPHIEVKLDEQNGLLLARSIGEQNDAAAKSPEQPAQAAAAKPDAAAAAGKPREAAEQQKPPFRDVPLERAVDVLKGVLVQAQAKSEGAAAAAAATK